MKIALKVYIFEEALKHFYKMYVWQPEFQNLTRKKKKVFFDIFFFKSERKCFIKNQIVQISGVTEKKPKNSSFLKSTWYTH